MPTQDDDPRLKGYRKSQLGIVKKCLEYQSLSEQAGNLQMATNSAEKRSREATKLGILKEASYIPSS
jgi:hypothetical protein